MKRTRAGFGTGNKGRQLSFCLIESFIEGFKQAATRTNCMAGFRASGICPFDPSIPRSPEYMPDSRLGETEQQIFVTRMVLPAEGGLRFLSEC
jgi:hypothetical protein